MSDAALFDLGSEQRGKPDPPERHRLVENINPTLHLPAAGVPSRAPVPRSYGNNEDAVAAAYSNDFLTLLWGQAVKAPVCRAGKFDTGKQPVVAAKPKPILIVIHSRASGFCC